MDELVKLYISQLTLEQRKVLELAESQLKSSFNIEKSIGFIQFKTTYKAS